MATREWWFSASPKNREFALSATWLWQFECNHYRGREVSMKTFALFTLLMGALMLVHPDATFAQNRGGGGNRSGGNRGQSFSGQRGGGRQSFSAPRAPSRGQSFSS